MHPRPDNAAERIAAEVEKGAARARAALLLRRFVRAHALKNDLRSLTPAEADGYARQLARALDCVEQLGVTFSIVDAPAGGGKGISATLTFKDRQQ